MGGSASAPSFEAIVSKNIKSIIMFSILKIFIANDFINFLQSEYSLDNVFLYLAKMQGLQCPVERKPNTLSHCLKEACHFRDSVSNKELSKENVGHTIKFWF